MNNNIVKDKVVILGGRGMLGTDLERTLLSAYDVVVLDRDDGDITNEILLKKTISTIKPQWIINCAAMTNVDGCEADHDTAFAINGHAVKNIITAAKAEQARIIHISTDYVFDGQREEGYEESCIKNPISTYGKSKAMAEDILLKDYPEASYIVRTAWLYGEHGKNFVYSMLDLARKGSELRVVDDQVGSPTYTVDLSQAIKNIIDMKHTPGIYHVTNAGRTSWHGFAQEIFRCIQDPIVVIPVSTEAFPRPAKRPAYSVLLNTKLPPLRHWKDALQEFLKTI